MNSFIRILRLSRTRLLIALLLIVSGFNMDSAAQITMKTVAYKGWQNNLQLSNGTVELIMTLDVGPRVIRYGFVGGPNVFKEFDEQMGKSGESEWQSRGGHRLWHAPEDVKRTYALDNSPIKYEKLGDLSVRLIQPVESITGIQKEMDITLDASGTGVTVVHRLRNTNLWDVEIAPWALSVMAQGGVGITPLPEKIAHPGSLEPGEKPDYRGFETNQSLILWPFTDLADPRLHLGTRYITLRQDQNAKKPNKIGYTLKTGWVGYLNKGILFVKGIPYQAGRTYTDGGSNFETFTNKDFLEVESLGPLEKIPQGKAIEHTEQWWLLKDIPNDTSEAAIDANIRPKVEALIKR